MKRTSKETIHSLERYGRVDKSVFLVMACSVERIERKCKLHSCLGNPAGLKNSPVLTGSFQIRNVYWGRVFKSLDQENSAAIFHRGVVKNQDFTSGFVILKTFFKIEKSV